MERDNDEALTIEALRDKCDEMEDAIAGFAQLVGESSNECVAMLKGVESRYIALEAERDRLQSTVAALERERSNFAHIALRVIDNDYLAWQAAGGPRECEHGRAEGIPCPECDIVTVRSFLAEEERLAALAEPTRDLQAEVQRDQRESPDINSATSL